MITSRSVASERAVAGEGVLHPLGLAAVTVLVLNDHLLKAAFPGVLTGKLSDFAGLALLPLLLQAVFELFEVVIRGRVTPSRGVFLVAAGFTAFAFCLMKTLPSVAEAYRYGLGALRWALAAAVDSLGGAPVRAMSRVALARDVTDLVALPAAFAGLVVQGRRRSTSEVA